MLKVKVDVPTFFMEGIKNEKDDFLIALINGYQGSSKTQFAIYNVEKNYRGYKIKTNIKSYDGELVGEVEHFTKLSDLYNDHELYCVYIIDEMSKKYTKNSPIDLDFYSWLQQSRKHHRVVFMIFQEYIQVPNWLRGVANVSYVTHKVPLTPILITDLGKPVLDNETCEWGLDIFSKVIYKRTKKICSLYDTYETIDTL